MSAPSHALLADTAELRQRHHLIAAGIGQDRLLPMHEAVEPAELGDALRSGAEHQVVGIGEQNVGARGGDVLGKHRLDRCAGADRHEGGRPHDSARRRNRAHPRKPIPRRNLEGEGSRHRPLPAELNRQASP
jgi:hypothetical protein